MTFSRINSYDELERRSESDDRQEDEILLPSAGAVPQSFAAVFVKRRITGYRRRFSAARFDNFR